MDENGNFHYPVKPRLVMKQLNNSIRQWAPTDNNGYFIKPHMDFDEFLELALLTGVTPVIATTVLVDLFDSSVISYQDFLKTIEEQVKYAVAKGATKAYWEIGNEMESIELAGYISEDPKVSVPLYIKRYHDIYNTIKRVDPTAKIGPGLLYAGTTSEYGNWARDILEGTKDKMEHLVTHQYGNTIPGPIADYEIYKEFNNSAITKINCAKTALRNLGPAYEDMEIIVTEFTSKINSRKPGYADVGGIMYKALFSMDIIGQMMNVPGITQIHQYVTRTPFRSLNAIFNFDIATEDTNSFYFNGTPTIMGMPVLIASKHLRETSVSAGSSSKYVNVYASKSSDGAKSIIIVNKDDLPSKVNINITNNATPANVKTYQLTGATHSPMDRDFDYQEIQTATIGNNTINTTLSPASITVISIDANGAFDPKVTSRNNVSTVIIPAHDVQTSK